MKSHNGLRSNVHITYFQFWIPFHISHSYTSWFNTQKISSFSFLQKLARSLTKDNHDGGRITWSILEDLGDVFFFLFFLYFFSLFLSPFLVRSCAIFPVLWTVSFHRLLRSFEQIYSIYSLNLEGSRPIT